MSDVLQLIFEGHQMHLVKLIILTFNASMHFCDGKGMKVGENRFSALNLQHVMCFSLRKSENILKEVMVLSI